MIDRLASKVEAVNRCHKLANEFAADLRKALTPWLGKQIIKADGQLMARFKPAVDVLCVYRPDLQIVRSHWGVSCIDFDIKVSYATGADSCAYYTVAARVANARDCMLIDFRPEVLLKTDYKVEDIRAIKAEIEAARTLLHAAESKLSPFREND